MRPLIVGVVVAGVALAGAGSPALAQVRPTSQQEEAQAQARYKVFVMEGALERAVQQGAAVLSRQVRALSPDAMFLTGGAQVRGFRLDGYGVFFDVEVPGLRPTAAWTLRAMIDDNGASLARIREYVSKVTDPRDRAELELALRNLEVLMPGRIGVSPESTQVAAQSVVGQTVSRQPILSPADRLLLTDPNAAYTQAVKAALIDAMLENSGPLAIGNDEWLTIAARDGEAPSRLVPGDAYDASTTLLRVKGADLAAYRAGRLSLDEARKRVEVKEN